MIMAEIEVVSTKITKTGPAICGGESEERIESEEAME